MEWIISWAFVVLSLVLIIYRLNNQPIIEWLFIFFYHVSMVTYIDSFVVANHLLEYPIRFFPDVFKISVLFDLLVCPSLAVLFNQTTLKSTIGGIIVQLILYLSPLIYLEYLIEKYTNLITYLNWTWYYSFLSLGIQFLVIRGTIALIRRVSDREVDVK
ncbi:MAG: CBO0543 family protein [Bacillota bacterium]